MPATLSDFAAIPARRIAPGFSGHYVHSPAITIGRVDIEAGARLPEHSHPQVIDVFHPPRDDYR